MPDSSEWRSEGTIFVEDGQRSVVHIAAKAYDVDLSYSGRENSEMPGESQDGYSSNVGGTDGRRLPARGLARSWINYKTIT
jgi:hypothetical protein